MSIVESFLHDACLSESPRLTDERLEELRRLNLPHATKDVWGVALKEDGPIEERETALGWIASIDKYLEDFLPSGPCPNCGRKASFSYGICHGEGQCSCGYPGRGCHYPKADDGSEILSLRDFVLWYHPSVIERAK